MHDASVGFYVANRNVIRDCLKLFPTIIGFRKLSDREFQTDGRSKVRVCVTYVKFLLVSVTVSTPSQTKKNVANRSRVIYAHKVSLPKRRFTKMTFKDHSRLSEMSRFDRVNMISYSH